MSGDSIGSKMQQGPIFKNQIYQVKTLHNKGFHLEFAKGLGKAEPFRLLLKREFNSISAAKPQLWSKTPDPRLHTSVIYQECHLLNAQFPPLSMVGGGHPADGRRPYIYTVPSRRPLLSQGTQRGTPSQTRGLESPPWPICKAAVRL